VVVIRCEAPTEPDNGNVSVSGYYYGAVAKFWCQSGYNMTGSDSATCQQTGNWSAPSPSCRLLSGYWLLFRLTQSAVFNSDQCKWFTGKTSLRDDP